MRIILAVLLGFIWIGIANAEPGRLGGGYRDFKWGISKKAVRDKLKGKGRMESSQDSIDIMAETGWPTLEFKFFHGVLYGVIYHPSTDRAEIVKMLEEKFGPATQSIPGTIRWSDGETNIDVQWEPNPLPHVSDGLKVIYSNEAMVKKLYAEKQAATDAKKTLEENKKREELRGH